MLPGVTPGVAISRFSNLGSIVSIAANWKVAESGWYSYSNVSMSTFYG